MKTQFQRPVFWFLLGILCVCSIAGTKISRLTTTPSVDGNALLVVVTGATQKATRQITASNFLNSLEALPNWTGGSGGGGGGPFNTSQFSAVGGSTSIVDGVPLTGAVMRSTTVIPTNSTLYFSEGSHIVHSNDSVGTFRRRAAFWNSNGELIPADGSSGRAQVTDLDLGWLDGLGTYGTGNGKTELSNYVARTSGVATGLTVRGLALPTLSASRVVVTDPFGNVTNVVGFTGSEFVRGDGSLSTPGGTGEINVNADGSTTNATRISLLVGKTGVSNVVKTVEAGYGMTITNLGGTNLQAAVLPIFQPGSQVVSNFAGTGGITNVDTNGLFAASGTVYNNGAVHLRHAFFDDFNRPEGATKTLGFASTGQKWPAPITYGPNGAAGWKFTNGFIMITNPAAWTHNYGPTFYQSNAPIDAYNLVGAFIRHSYPNGLTNGNQAVIIGFNTNASFIPGMLSCSIDGNLLRIDVNQVMVTNWTLTTPSYESNYFHRLEFIRTGKNLCAVYDGKPYIYPYTNQASMALNVVTWTLYGQFYAQSRQDWESGWADYATPEQLAIADGGSPVVKLAAGSNVTITYDSNTVPTTATIAATGGGGGGSPGGSENQVQFNRAGAFGGTNTFTYDPTNETLSIFGNSAAGTVIPGLVLSNTVAATSGNQRSSPGLRFAANGFNSGGSTSSPIEFEWSVLPAQANPVTGTLYLSNRVGGAGAWSSPFSFSSAGTMASSSGGFVFNPNAGTIQFNSKGMWDQSGGGFVVDSSAGYHWNSLINNPSSAFIDCSMFRDAANTIALRRGTNSQALRIYNSYTDSANYSRLAINANQIASESLGNGSLTVTSSTPVLNLSQIWSNSAQSFTGLTFNATDTGSLSNSVLFNLSSSGNSVLAVDKGGKVTVNGFILNRDLSLPATASLAHFNGTNQVYTLILQSNVLVSLTNLVSDVRYELQILNTNCSTLTWSNMPSTAWMQGAAGPGTNTGWSIVRFRKDGATGLTNASVIGFEYGLNVAGTLSIITNATSLTLSNPATYLLTTTFIPTNSSQSNYTIAFSPTVPAVDLFITNNITLTNWTGLGDGTNINTVLYITPQLIPRGVAYPTLGGPGYSTRWFTNAASPLWTTLTNGITYALSLSSRGTNVHASITEWK